MCSHPWTGIRINVASGNGMMGSYLKLKETDYAQCQFQGDDGGPRYYKAFVHASMRDGAPCWLVRMPEVWPNVKVLQMDIADKQIHVSLAFTGEHLMSLKFRGKKTFDFLEEVVIAWDLKYDHDPLCRLCSFSLSTWPTRLTRRIGSSLWRRRWDLYSHRPRHAPKLVQ